MSKEQLFSAAKAKLDTLLQDRMQFYENADLKISLEGYGACTALLVLGACALPLRVGAASSMYVRAQDKTVPAALLQQW